MDDPFESPDGSYVALMNDDGQYALWPESLPVPAGWQVVCGPDRRDACLDHIERHWTDMRPRSLVVQMDSAGA
ncbi:MbtH family protein [Micromonospora sp. NPDC048868]|uniref:MbtH family protein n=1 Tax=Micromonospora sp. NPDC048868 TaxID=3364258 RepID=UPI0037235FF0